MSTNNKIKNPIIVYFEKYEDISSEILSAERNCKILSKELVENHIKYKIENRNHTIYLVINRKEYNNAIRLLLMTGLDFFAIYYENHNKEVV
jgi:hypothetical protein